MLMLFLADESIAFPELNMAVLILCNDKGIVLPTFGSEGMC